MFADIFSRWIGSGAVGESDEYDFGEDVRPLSDSRITTENIMVDSWV
jgi:hypothetical protein